MEKKITIKTKAGKLITRKAIITDYINGDGTQFSYAQVGVHLYKIIERTADENIWQVVGKDD